jgi:hypothetical protein
MSELPSERRDTFDLEQMGVHGYTEETIWTPPDARRAQEDRFGHHNEYPFRANIVDAIRTGAGIGKGRLQKEGRGGMFRFYTANLLCHDCNVTFVRGNRIRFAYGAIFAPFIPIWWIGEEWDNPRNPLPGPGSTGVLYFNTIDWTVKESSPGREFFEDAKRYIRIRRTYPEIFEFFPESTRDANITKLATTREGVSNPLQAYARFASGKAVLVVPNYGGNWWDEPDKQQKADCPDARFEITPDYGALGLVESGKAGLYRITDLMTSKVLIEETNRPKSFTTSIAGEHLGVYLVERA